MSFRPAPFRPTSRRALAVVAALAAVPLSAQPPMTVATFLARAEPLRANPLTALVSPDYSALKAEADAATRQLRADAAQRKAAGKPPIACVPDGRSVGIMEMLSGLDALSPAEKRLPLAAGYAHVLAKRYPC